jgi:hypothetical protein
MSVVKTILIAHHRPAVGDRFAAALADARQAFVRADSERESYAAVAGAASPIGLALVDLTLAADAAAFVRTLRQRAGYDLRVAVFAGSLSSAEQVPQLISAGVAGYVNEHAAGPQILPALAPHLFPDNFDRRTSPRVALGVPVSCRAGRTITVAYALNIGCGGLSVRTMTPLPSSRADIEATGRVAWSDRKVGMGIQLERLRSDDQSTIDLFVDEHRP